jgi:hypothetical protein
MSKEPDELSQAHASPEDVEPKRGPGEDILRAEDVDFFERVLEKGDEETRALNHAIYEESVRAARDGRPAFELMLLQEQILHDARTRTAGTLPTDFSTLMRGFENWHSRDILADALGVPKETFADLTRGELSAFDLMPVLVARIGYRLGLSWEVFIQLMTTQWTATSLRATEGTSGTRMPSTMLDQLRELWDQVEVSDRPHDD